MNLKNKLLDFLGWLFSTHFHNFNYYDLKPSRGYTFSFMQYQKRVCRCGLKQKRVFTLDQEGGVMGSGWKNV